VGFAVLADRHRRAVELGRAARGLSQLDREEVVPAGVERLPVLGDGTAKLPHRAREAVGQPLAFETVPRDDAGALQLDEVGPLANAAANRALAAVDPERIAGAVGRRANAANRGGRAILVLDQDPGAPRRLRLGRLRRVAVLERPYAHRRLPGQPAARDVDPVRREVVDDEVLELVGPGSERPVEVVLVEVRHGAHLPDRALLDKQGRDPPGRRPATVLVDGDPQPAALGL
jgi:hypothetical protein